VNPSDCPASTHASTRAYANGCRCPESVAKHADEARRYRERRGQKVKPVRPNCAARNHDTASAYRRDGCICPDAKAAYEQYNARRRAAYGEANIAEPAKFTVQMYEYQELRDIGFSHEYALRDLGWSQEAYELALKRHREELD
jgi:hypothetical protein